MIEILWDWHGSLVDFASAIAAIHRVDLGPQVEGRVEIEHGLGIDPDRFWSRSDLLLADWWKRLPRLVALESIFIQAAADPRVEMRIVSSPASPLRVRKAEVWGTTIAAIDRFEIAPWFVPKKADLWRPGRILVDDNQQQIDAWRARGGSAVTAPAPWNATRAWPIGGAIDAFRAALQNAIAIEGSQWT